MKAVVAAFNQEKALVGAFSVITNLRMELFQALITISITKTITVPTCPGCSRRWTSGWARTSSRTTTPGRSWRMPTRSIIWVETVTTNKQELLKIYLHSILLSLAGVTGLQKPNVQWCNVADMWCKTFHELHDLTVGKKLSQPSTVTHSACLIKRHLLRF